MNLEDKRDLGTNLKVKEKKEVEVRFWRENGGEEEGGKKFQVILRKLLG